MIKDTDIPQIVLAISSALASLSYNPIPEASPEAKALYEAAVAGLQALMDDVDLLQLQVNGIAMIDLGGGNATLPVEDCKCKIKYITNANAGGSSVLTMPTAGDAYQPITQVFIVAGIAGNVSLAMQTDTTYSPATLETAKTSYQIVVAPGTILLPISSL